MDPSINLPTPLVKAGRWVRSRWDWAATIAGLLIAGGILYFVAIGGTATREIEAPRPTPAPPAFAPIRIVRLEVEPETLRLGQPGRLLNGICNDTDHDQAVALYFGAQSVGGDPILARVVDFAGRDTPEGRMRVVISPGCYRTAPIESAVGGGLTPGPWKLVLKVSAIGPAGEEQNVTTTSRVFDVLAAE